MLERRLELLSSELNGKQISRSRESVLGRGSCYFATEIPEVVPKSSLSKSKTLGTAEVFWHLAGYLPADITRHELTGSSEAPTRPGGIPGLCLTHL